MRWLDEVVEQVMTRQPEGEIVVSSGVSPSGKYHVGTLREILTAELIARELRRRKRQAKHLHIVDDLDIFRKVPAGLPEEFAEHLGKPLCDVPAPDGSDQSYADFYVQDLILAAEQLHLSMDIVRSHERYRSGYFVTAIEKVLDHQTEVRNALQTISGRKLDDSWSPIQVIEDGRLKNRQFLRLNQANQTLVFMDGSNQEQTISYATGDVKLSWRVDWPARWWRLNVMAEPFGRDHATKGGSYDTGAEIAKQIFGIKPPVPVPYHFINRTGDTKKMSKSAGDTITIAGLLELLPAEVIWYFVIRFAPDKQLFFDAQDTLIRLMDEFGELLAKPDKTVDEQWLVDMCMHDIAQPTVSRVPFSLLVSSYQAALKNATTTLEIIKRSEYEAVATADEATIKRELRFIDAWLKTQAPEEVRFELLEQLDSTEFSEAEATFLQSLGNKVATAPQDADGAWFHERIYELKDTSGLAPKDMFSLIYRATIGKTSGPRAGWFLSILPRDWLIKRLKLEQ